MSLAGTGKTMMAKAIAKEGKLAFISTLSRARAPTMMSAVSVYTLTLFGSRKMQTSILPPSSTNGMANRR
jgi:hypothetical protein